MESHIYMFPSQTRFVLLIETYTQNQGSLALQKRLIGEIFYNLENQGKAVYGKIYLIKNLEEMA